VPDPDDEELTLSGRVTEARISPMALRSRDRATLTVVSGPETGKVFSLGDLTVIGRGRDCTIRLDDSGVSRMHARIARQPDGARFQIEDLGSRNGTFIGGYRVKTARGVSERFEPS
jgi:pSer/pThr/pTyr-binding forkhead associated (FHA) protein